MRQVAAVAGQLGRVLHHPGLEVVLGHQVADPAFAVLGPADVGGQIVREVADAVDQRISEGHRQPGERADSEQRYDGNCDPAPPEPAPEHHDEGVQEQRNEASDH